MSRPARSARIPAPDPRRAPAAGAAAASRVFAFDPAARPAPRARLDRLFTAAQRRAADALVAGPLERDGNAFRRAGQGQEQGAPRAVQLQPLRALCAMGLASFVPGSGTVRATRKLIALYEEEAR